MNTISNKLLEQDYRYFFDNASDAIWIHDLEGNITYANKAAEELTGFSHERLLRLNVSKLLTDAKSREIANDIRNKLLKGQKIQQPYEQCITRKDGSKAILRMAASIVTKGGKVKGIQHIARDFTEQRRLQENMRFYVQEIIRAQEDERKRIARELHDDVSPQLLLLIQQIDAITSNNRLKLSDHMKQKLEGLRCQTVEGLESLRRIAQDLRPRILDDLGLIPALEWMTDNLIMNHGIEAQVQVNGKETNLPMEVQLLLFRIAQEALNNTRRHANASLVVVKVDFSKEKTELTISDNGEGFQLPKEIDHMPTTGKLGLAGMQERAQLLGGVFIIESQPGTGTTVNIKIPTKKPNITPPLGQGWLEAFFTDKSRVETNI